MTVTQWNATLLADERDYVGRLADLQHEATSWPAEGKRRSGLTVGEGQDGVDAKIQP